MDKGDYLNFFDKNKKSKTPKSKEQIFSMFQMKLKNPTHPQYEKGWQMEAIEKYLGKKAANEYGEITLLGNISPDSKTLLDLGMDAKQIAALRRLNSKIIELGISIDEGLELMTQAWEEKNSSSQQEAIQDSEVIEDVGEVQEEHSEKKGIISGIFGKK